MAGICEAVKRMEAAGYQLAVDGGTLRVAPAERLNEEQRRWLTRNKPALVRHVKALALPDVREMVERFEAEVMAFEEHVCQTPIHPPTPVFTRGESCG